MLAPVIPLEPSIAQMDDSFRIRCLSKALYLEFATLLMIEGLVSNQRHLPLTQLLEAASTINQLVEDIHYVLALAIHADADAYPRQFVHESAKTSEELFEVRSRICIDLAIAESVINFEISLPV